MNQTVRVQVLSELFPSLKMYSSFFLCYHCVYWGCCQWRNWYLSLLFDGFLSLCGCWLLVLTARYKRVLALCFGGADTKTWCLLPKLFKKSGRILLLHFMVWITLCVFCSLIHVTKQQNWSRSAIKDHHSAVVFLPCCQSAFGWIFSCKTNMNHVTSRIECTVHGTSLNL